MLFSFGPHMLWNNGGGAPTETLTQGNRISTHLDQLHDQVELIVSVHLLYEQDDIWMFDPAQNGHLILNHVLLKEIRTEVNNLVK